MTDDPVALACETVGTAMAQKKDAILKGELDEYLGEWTVEGLKDRLFRRIYSDGVEEWVLGDTPLVMFTPMEFPDDGNGIIYATQKYARLWKR